ncbi:MAG TPA: metallophosphoesterase [Solirubrobacteraceae bacterium]|nr:metallophosphoesterase [Solirubrobacteraceae bacterium]
MRTLLISDLHLGNRGRRDVLREPAALARLVATLDGVDRLVLLGDTLEYHGRHAERALLAAEPVLEAIGAAMAGREIVLVPGNHDHDLIRRWVRDRGDRLGVEEIVAPGASSGLARVLAALAPARVTVRYPGVWLAPRVYASHGHYADRQLRPESAIGRLRRRRPASVGPAGYERDHRLRPARRRRRTGLAGAVARVRARVLFTLPPLLLRPRTAPLIARTLDRQMRHHAIPAQLRVLEDLGIDADYAIFGHVHRLGPLPGENRAPWGTQPMVLNTGSWQYEALLAGRGKPPNPYWPGGAVLIEDERPPRAIGLLDDLARAGWDPGATSAGPLARPALGAAGQRDGAGRPGAAGHRHAHRETETATVGGTCPSCCCGPRP